MTTTKSAFADVPRDARGHLGLHFYAAAFHLIYHLRTQPANADRTLDEILSAHPFLVPYFTQIRDRLPDDIAWEQSLFWLRDQILVWEQTASVHLPLAALRDSLRLDFTGLIAFVLAGMVEERAEFAALFARPENPQSGGRLTLAALQHILESEHSPEAWPLVRPLVESGFLHVVNRDFPRAEWSLRVPGSLWSAVRGECSAVPLEGARFHPLSSLEPVSDLLIEPGLRRQLLELAGLARCGRIRAVVLRGMPGTDRLAAISAVASELGCGVLEVECTTAQLASTERARLIGPLCALTRSIPVFSFEAGPGEILELPSLAGYNGLAAALLGREGGISGADAAHAVTVHLDIEPAETRLEIWQRALSDQASGCQASELPRIASAFCLPARHIRQCARLAADYAALERRDAIVFSDVRWAARALNRQMLDNLASRIEGNASWPQLVTRSATSSELHTLETRCRHREQLASAFAATMPGGMNRGVRALFEGPSGTGKTLAARVLASELGLDLYRIDLAALVNKFVGETEKNLSRVLGRAEDLNVILLLDEGDSLMTRRTEVKTANDRYANLETNYLLQRLETYTGIVVVTTNAGQSIDTAFRRRFDAVVKFHLPDPAERWQLWRGHLPENHEIDSDSLDNIALHYQLSGGQIRNVCVQAALAALASGGRPLGLAELKAALRSEHRKAGSSFVDTPAAGAGRNSQAIAAFAGGLS